MVKRSGGRVVRKTPRRRAMRLPEDVDMVAMPLTGVRVVLHQIKRELVGGEARGFRQIYLAGLADEALGMLKTHERRAEQLVRYVKKGGGT